MLSEKRLRSTSISMTRPRTTWPMCTTSPGRDVKLCDSSLTCTSASWASPTSTNTPKLAMRVITPSSSLPTVRSAKLVRSDRTRRWRTAAARCDRARAARRAARRARADQRLARDARGAEVALAARCARHLLGMPEQLADGDAEVARHLR